jgi:GNAT superfamily N-acetyltransferase
MGNVAQRTIEARVAERADFGPWLELAVEVEPLFGPMVQDPVFQRALLRNIARGTAFCIRENEGHPGSRLVAGLLLSPRPPVYRIGWLVVTESERRSGLGRTILHRALAGIEPPAEILVITFGPDVPGGESARSFYQKMGFTPGEMSDPAPNGASRQVFRKGLEVAAPQAESPRTSATS